MRRRWLLFAVILTAPSGCDNVTWGGVKVRLQDPPATADTTRAAAAEVEAAVPLPPLPKGPILLAGARDGDEATLVAVGEVRGDGLAPFPTEAQAPGFQQRLANEVLLPGTEMILFSEGARVGRLTVSETSVDDRFCVPRTAVKGVVELTPGASNAQSLMALTDTAAHRRPFTPHRTWTHDYDQRVASLNLATEAIPAVGAAWPPSLLESRADIQVFRLPEASGSSVVATFLVGDRLAVTSPSEGAYALFVMGGPSAGGYASEFIWYRSADREGKGAPRYFGHLDWNGDGRSQILLDVFGAQKRWFAALSQRSGTWVRTYQDPCGEPTG